jgi:hypothetical protein
LGAALRSSACDGRNASCPAACWALPPAAAAAHLQAEDGGDACICQPVCVVRALQAAAHHQVRQHRVEVDAVLMPVRQRRAHLGLHLNSVLAAFAVSISGCCCMNVLQYGVQLAALFLQQLSW